MKRILFAIVALSLCVPTALRAQDAATEERLNKLSGQLENIIEAQRAQQKQIEALAREIESVREQANKPTGNYATQDELREIAKALKEVERKRTEDAEKISAQLTKLGQKVSAPAPPPRKSGSQLASNAPANTEKATEKGYPYKVQQGDTLSVIVQAYREKNIKVTTDQILKANPGLKAEKLKVGQEIWIPAPQS